MSALNDPEAVRRQYATDKNLLIRQDTHEKYTVPRKNFAEWVLSCVDWRGDEVVLDIGCGPGMYYRKMRQRDDLKGLRYIGMDVSPGMLLKHPADPQHLLYGDARWLPFEDDSFDVLMANHMLYHVEDIEGAIKEFRRVLKPDGLLMVATNSVTTMPEFQVLLRRAIVLLTRHNAAQVRPPEPASNLFALENGTRVLARHFYAVVRHEFPGKLVFKEVEPAIDYLESSRDMREPQLPDDVTWEDVMMIMSQQITQLINHLGSLEIDKTSGLLVASDTGGFIQEFVESKQAATTPKGE